MQLDSRKIKILEYIIDEYIKNGEPIGSKTIAQALNNSLSPATIRNEMAVLYEFGFLEQPHTSAGRVPSQLGYRLYIDKIMSKKPIAEGQKSQIDSWFSLRNPDYTTLIKNTGKILAETTLCTAILSSMVCESLIIKRIEIIEVANRTLAVVLITSSGIVKSEICRVNFNLIPDIIHFIFRFVNESFAGQSVEKISQAYIKSLVDDVSIYTSLLTSVLHTIYQMCKSLHTSNFYISGQTNLLSYKEFRNNVTDILKLLSNEDNINNIINEFKEDLGQDYVSGVANVKFGRELKNPELANVSLVISKYDIGLIGVGNILIIGPNRLNYAYLVPWVEYFSQSLSLMLSESLEIR